LLCICGVYLSHFELCTPSRGTSAAYDDELPPPGKVGGETVKNIN
jgi:hypothetical protein